MMPGNNPPNDHDLQLGAFLCFTIYSANHAFNSVYKPLLDRIGLTYPQYLAMVVLWQQDGQTVGQMCDKLFLESSTLTPLLKRLEAAELIVRQRDPADERRVIVTLTEKGIALKEQAADIPACILEASGMTAGKLQELQQEIATLRSHLLNQK